MGFLANLKAKLGWATADRRAEAEGRLAQLDPDDDGSGDDGSSSRSVDPEELLDEAELHVRADHGDLSPGAEPGGRVSRTPPEPG